MNYHISWLEIAIQNIRKDGSFYTINGDMTMAEFIQKWCKEEFNKAVRVK